MQPLTEETMKTAILALSDKMQRALAAVCGELGIPTEYDVLKGKCTSGYDWTVLFCSTVTAFLKILGETRPVVASPLEKMLLIYSLVSRAMFLVVEKLQVNE